MDRTTINLISHQDEGNREKEETCSNTGSNTVNMATTSITNKGYKVDIKKFGSVITLRYKKVELKKYFDVF